MSWLGWTVDMAGRYILFGGPINTGDNLYRWNYDTANHLIHMLYYGKGRYPVGYTRKTF